MKSFIFSPVLCMFTLASFAEDITPKLPKPDPPAVCSHTSSAVATLMGTSIQLTCTASAANCTLAIALAGDCIFNAKRKFSTLIFLTDF